MKKVKQWNPILFFLLLIPLVASQCEEPGPFYEGDKLPPVTTEGKGTFGCKVNGEVWIPWSKFDLLDSYITTTYHSPTGGINIYAKKVIEEQDLFQSISFGGTGIMGVGNYEYWGRYNDYDSAFCNDYTFDIDTTLGDKLKIIYLDTENKIISGTFEFTAINEECDPVVITEGRFDLTY